MGVCRASIVLITSVLFRTLSRGLFSAGHRDSPIQLLLVDLCPRIAKVTRVCNPTKSSPINSITDDQTGLLGMTGDDPVSKPKSAIRNPVTDFYMTKVELTQSFRQARLVDGLESIHRSATLPYSDSASRPHIGNRLS